MTVEEKKQYLGRYRDLQNEIAGLTAEIEKWQTIGEKVNNALGIGGSSNVKKSKIESSAVNVVDIISDIQVRINTAKDIRKEIENAIENGCKWYRHKELLKLKYINGMGVGRIARLLGKEEKTISNMLSSAIKELKI